MTSITETDNNATLKRSFTYENGKKKESQASQENKDQRFEKSDSMAQDTEKTEEAEISTADLLVKTRLEFQRAETNAVKSTNKITDIKEELKELELEQESEATTEERHKELKKLFNKTNKGLKQAEKELREQKELKADAKLKVSELSVKLKAENKEAEILEAEKLQKELEANALLLKQKEDEAKQLGLDTVFIPDELGVNDVRQILDILSATNANNQTTFLEDLQVIIKQGTKLNQNMPDTFLAIQICKTFEGFKDLAKDKVSRELYRYTGTHWEHIEEDYLLDKLTRICCQQMHCSLGKIHSVFGAILRKSGIKPERKAGLIAVRNGVYSTKDQCFLDHSKKHGNCGFIDVDYTSKAKECPVFDKFINDLSNGSEERKAIILAVIYYHIANKYDAKMFTEIVGDGDTGKTTLNKFICMLVGNENVAHLDLRNIEGSKRSPHALEGVDRKAMISYAEMESARGEFQTTKSISGGEEVMINPKNKKQYSRPIRATQMFTGNQPIEVLDKGSAILNRRVVVVLTKEFKGKDKDKNLLEKLTKEIPAIINKLTSYMTENKFNQIIKTAFLSTDKSSVLYKTDAIYRFIAESLIVTNNITDFAETGNRAEYNKATDKTKLSRAKRKLYECYLLWHETQEDLKGVKDFTLNAFKELLLNWLKKAFNLEKHFDFKKTTNNIRGLPGVTINTKCPHLAEFTEEVRRNHTYESVRTE